MHTRAKSQQEITGLKTLCGVVVCMWQLTLRPLTSEVWTESRSRRKDDDAVGGGDRENGVRRDKDGGEEVEAEMWR
ncbi:hypothetical protein CesoFtcFv8_023089 [Champsocephalus esox]|uniref:Uncharacterized protein n=1 Tax=Champsocephalus esox TaxID=159716 RepID=A0AAN8B8S6_9TELE|nr:hypothetical protein CesoFtcFv8_023089 [Champsocephalus esox]